MSTNNRIFVLIGLTMVGSMGWATAPGAADGPEPPAADSSPAAAAPAPREQFLLLTNGQLIQGVITQQGSQYLVRQRVGMMPFPKQRVEGVFNSVPEAGQYRVQQLPDRDYDERFKLALWCLNHKLNDQAKDLLADIVQHNPNYSQARDMLVSIGQAATRGALSPRDPDVRQTAADEMADSRPGALEAAVLRRAQRELGISNLPVIFDLPVPLAIKRAEEFARIINPLLQKNCAKCHNSKYDGPFQLVLTNNRADRTPEALRANLDATLRLVDPQKPSHSMLLSSTLRPHGRGPRPRPIFTGSNDPNYAILAAWVHNLGSPQNGDEPNRAEGRQPRSERVETFAADRNQVGRDLPDRDEPPFSGRAARSELPAGMAAERKIPAPSRFMPGRAPIPAGAASADPEEFPLPFAITGVRPKLGPPDAGSKPGTKSGVPPTSNSASSRAPAPAASSSGPAKSASPGAVSTASGEQTKGKDGTGAAKSTSKPLTIDPKLLERALQSRNQGP
jgi:hypothetical protein